MNQKKHLNAIAALAASKDAEPGRVWSLGYCQNTDCDRCYAIPFESLYNCYGLKRTVSEVRAALQSGLDAYHKRKAEKDDRLAIGCAHYFIRDVCELCRKTRDEIAEDKKPSPSAPLITDPPDTPEVRKQMEARAAWKEGDLSPCCKFGSNWFCDAEEDRQYFSGMGREDVHAFARSWLSRHPAVWDAEKGRFTMAGRHDRMRKWAEAVIKHYPIPDKDAATVWQPGMMDSRLLADEVIAYLADEARRQGWKR